MREYQIRLADPAVWDAFDAGELLELVAGLSGRSRTFAAIAPPPQAPSAATVATEPQPAPVDETPEAYLARLRRRYPTQVKDPNSDD